MLSMTKGHVPSESTRQADERGSDYLPFASFTNDTFNLKTRDFVRL